MSSLDVSESRSPSRVQSPACTLVKLIPWSVGFRNLLLFSGRTGALPKVTRDLWSGVGAPPEASSAFLLKSLRMGGTEEAIRPTALSMLERKTM